MLAAFVLVVGILSSLVVLQRGFEALDTARNLTAATQVMQSEIERLRLLDWSELQALQDNEGTSAPLDASLTGGHFTCNRQIDDIKPGMKQIVLTASWHGSDGRLHTARLVTRYSQSGLDDYFYTVH